MNGKFRAMVGVGAASTALLFSQHARADVSNPDYYDIDIIEGAFIPVNLSGARIGDWDGVISGDLNTDTSFVYDDSAFVVGPTSVSGLNALVQVSSSGTSGIVDPGTGEVTLTLNLRIKFSGTIGVPASCQTAYFSVTASTTKSSTQSSSQSMSTSTGQFIAVAEDFSPPAVTTTACGATLAGNINSWFDLGNGSGSMAVYFQGEIVNPAIPQD